MSKIIIGVMGPGADATESDIENAFEIGKSIAQNGWVLLTGGVNQGVMHAASKGAKSEKGLTIGILPTKNPENVSEFVDIPIYTAMGSGRNYMNILSSNIVVACGMGPGTASEIILAIKENKKVILINCNEISQSFFYEMSKGTIRIANNTNEIISLIKELLI